MEPMGQEIQMEPKRCGNIWLGKMNGDQENRAGRSFLRWLLKCVSGPYAGMTQLSSLEVLRCDFSMAAYVGTQ